jgi:hypothetical protein
MRDPLAVVGLAAMALGAAALGGSAAWRATGRGVAPAATTVGLAAWIGAAGCAVWARKRAGDARAAAETPTVTLARGDWEPSPGTAAAARREQRPVALAPLEAALVAGVPAPHAVASLLAELARAGLVHYAPGEPPVLTVGRTEPTEAYGRLLARAAGQAIGAAAATALAAHAAAEAGRKLAAGGRAASAAWYAACWAEAGADGGPLEAPCDDPLGRPPASRALARDLASALDPLVLPATPWVRAVAAALGAGMPPVRVEPPTPIVAPADAALHTAVAAGAAVAGLPEASA